ncbi:MAG: ECF transporter S component [Clostridia bacterium]|nr:ECF transporter S component [Clostridia bacterium]
MNKSIKKIVIAALFAAFTCAATFISVPLPIGYANLGDVMVLLCGAVLGPVYGSLAAGLGSALADMFFGYAMYIPGTFIIKALMAFTVASLFKLISSKVKYSIVSHVISAVAAEIIMVGGYYLYESVCLSYGFGGAAASLFGNCMQGVVGVVASSALVIPLKKLMTKAKIL